MVEVVLSYKVWFDWSKWIKYDDEIGYSLIITFFGFPWKIDKMISLLKWGIRSTWCGKLEDYMLELRIGKR